MKHQRSIYMYLLIFSITSLYGCEVYHFTNQNTAEVPIKHVVLYQSGIGYIERHGLIEDDLLTIQIRPAQINDLLKSLTVIDSDGGRAVSISLPLEKTGDKILSELPKQVRQPTGLLDVLKVFRGALIEVVGKSGTIRGRVVGVENINADSPTQSDTPKTSQGRIPDWRLTLKAGVGELRVYPVSEISSIRIQDRSLEVGLNQSLDVSLGEGNWKPISLSVQLAGEAPHNIKASYIIEMPKWKPAYRLVLTPNGESLLQGWAIVDNVSGEDWENIQLSLVAGMPLSFVYDLHSPQYTPRVNLNPNKPTVNTSNSYQSQRTGRERLQQAFGGSKRSARNRVITPQHEIETPNIKKQTIIETHVQGAQVGALFRYDIKDAVTIPDRSSTLVAIINDRVFGEQVVLFRPDLTKGSTHSNPYRAVRVKNTSGFTLEQGPITLYAHNTFVGEGFLDRMEVGGQAFVTYSIDRNVILSIKENTSEEGMKLVKVVDGVITSEVLNVQNKIYKVINHHDKEITTYIKTSNRAGWTLKDRPKETFQTSDALYLPVKIAPHGENTLEVKWVSSTTRQLSIDTSLSTTLLKLYIEGSNGVPQTNKVIKEILKLKQKIAEIDRHSVDLKTNRAEFWKDQERVRRNLRLLIKTKGNKKLRRTLTKKLATLEGKLSQITTKLVNSSEERASLLGEMTVLIRSVKIMKNEGEEDKQKGAQPSNSLLKNVHREGQKLFIEHCSKCHGEDASGDHMRKSLPSIPNFRSSNLLNTKSDEELINTLKSGKGMMPPSHLKPKNIKKILTYLRSLHTYLEGEGH